MDVAQLSDERMRVFQQFSEAIKDCALPDASDNYKLTWLIARNFDAAAAERMIRKSLEWRRINQIDSVVETWKPPEVLVKFFPEGTSGYDKHGCPIRIHAAGRADLRGLFQSISRRDYRRHLLYIGEHYIRNMRIRSQETGKIVLQQTVIVDMDHLSLHQMMYKPAMDEGMELTQLMEANYPESLRRVFVVNAPKLFTMIFAIVKPVLHPLTIEKFSVYGHNAEEWKAALLQEIDADQLPAYFGGTQTDPDGNPMCLTRICYGGEVPRSYYLNKDKPQPREGMQSVAVARSSRKKFEFQVAVANSALRWEFLTIEGDIAFHVYRIGDGKESKGKVTLFPSRRVDSHTLVEEGVVVCTQPATYVAEFDNSFSYFRSKTVWYSFDIEEPAVDLPESPEESTPADASEQPKEGEEIDLRN